MAIVIWKLRLSDGAYCPVCFQPLEKRECWTRARFKPLESARDARCFVEDIVDLKAQYVVMDLHSIPWLNSLELGALLEVNKRCRATGRRLVLYAPHPKVCRLLEIYHLSSWFDTAFKVDELIEVFSN